MSVSSRRRDVPVLIGVAAAAAVGTVSLALYLRSSRRADVDHNSIEKAALVQLSRRFFNVCRDIAGVAKTVRSRIILENKSISEDSITKQLTIQCKVLEKLKAIEEDVAREFGCSVESIEAMQRGAVCREVQAYTQGFKTMLDDALEGQLPILPNTEIPPQLSQQRVLEIEREAQALELKKGMSKIDVHGSKSADLADVLEQATLDAWNETLERRDGEFGGGGQEVYYSALATFLRQPDFAAEKQRLDDAQQREMQTQIIQLFQQKQTGGLR